MPRDLPPGPLGNLARLSCVRIYSESEDAFYAGRGLIALHARSAGDKATALPMPMVVRELLAPGAAEPRPQVLRSRGDAADRR